METGGKGERCAYTKAQNDRFPWDSWLDSPVTNETLRSLRRGFSSPGVSAQTSIAAASLVSSRGRLRPYTWLPGETDNLALWLQPARPLRGPLSCFVFPAAFAREDRNEPRHLDRHLEI